MFIMFGKKLKYLHSFAKDFDAKKNNLKSNTPFRIRVNISFITLQVT